MFTSMHRLKPSDLSYVKECVAAPIIPLEVKNEHYAV